MDTEIITISSGSVESGLVIGFGTSLYVESGGTALDATILAGGGLVVESGGVASETTFGPGTSGIVSSGGVISDSVVQSAAVLTISSGGTDSVTSVASGGTLYAAGTVNSAITAASGAILHETFYVSTGEVLSGITVTSGIDIVVASGGTVVSADVQAGGEIDLMGGVVSGAVVDEGFFKVVWGQAISTTLVDGQLEAVGPGTLSATTIGAGASMYALYGGTAVSTTVQSGGFLYLSNTSNEALTVEAGGSATILSGLTSGQSLSGATISAYETLTVSSGAITTDLTVAAGGTINFLNTTEVGLTLDQGGTAFLLSSTVTDAVIAGELYTFDYPSRLSDATIVGSGVVRTDNLSTLDSITIKDSGALYDFGQISGTVTLADNGALIIGAYVSFSGTISGFGDGNSLVMQGASYTSGAFAVGEPGKLVVVEDGETTVIPLVGDYSHATFTVAADNIHGGSIITVSNAPCFAAGTRIETEDGARPVEALAVGDRVRRLDGSLAPVIWIGSRAVDCRRHPAPEAVRPIRIAADAFGDGVPSRPLLLSPDHAVWSEGVLIPVKHLVNGTSIRQITPETVQYFHVELAEHAVIFAEGLAVESYLDTGDRSAFLEAEGVTALHPVWGRDRPDAVLAREALAYAPLRVTGSDVARLRAHLAARAESRMPDAASG